MQQVGPYRLVREVARGGMGQVFLAHGPDGAPVALKLLHAHRARNPVARRRFQVEVETLRRLRHPHVVTVLDHGEAQGIPWLALEYCEGETLQARLRHGPLAVEDAVALAQQLADALRYVHSCGIAHRDLKPDNVLLDGSRALLTDFGLAHDELGSATRITLTGVFQGTPGYWAPEQARGAKHDLGPRTDLYGLGGVLYAALTGVPPIQATTLQEHLAAVERHQVTPPRALRSEVPPWLDALCLRCLAASPGARPASAEAVGRALAAGGRATPNRSRRPPVWLHSAVVLTLAGGALAWRTANRAEDPAPPAAVAPPADVQGAPEDLVEQGAPAPDPAEDLVEQGALLLQQAAWEDALAVFDRALAQDPRRPKAWTGRADALRLLRRLPPAEEAYSHAHALRPKDPLILRARGAVRLDRGDHPGAISDLRHALRLEPNNASAHAELGNALGVSGAHQDALVELDRALALDPQLFEALEYRAHTLCLLGRFAEGVVAFDRALALQPQNAGLVVVRGTAKFELGRYADAVADYDLAQTLDPSLTAVYGPRGSARYALGEPAAAVADLDRAIALEPDSVRLRYYRGAAQSALGNFGAGAVDLERALELDPTHQQARVGYVDCLLILERYAEALRALEPFPPDAPALVRYLRGRALLGVGRARDALVEFEGALATPNDARLQGMLEAARNEARVALGE